MAADGEVSIDESRSRMSETGLRLEQLRWWGAAIGVVWALFDTLALGWLGVSLQMNGRDVTLIVAGWFGVSFATLGFLLGDAMAGRKRSRQAAGVIREQMAAIEASRTQLAQSQKLAALGQLAAAIAHEVRNPLAVIRSAAQNIAETLAPGDSEARRACSFVTEETDRLSHLVNALLAFARPVQIAPRDVPVREFFDRALTLAGEELAAKRVQLRRGEADRLPTVSADPELMGQVFAGLVFNAAEAVATGGEIALEAEAGNHAVTLAVADSGPGVPPELRERVFEPFFTTRAKGIGLGLAIARQIVEAHGGRIEVGQSALGGARFAVIMPVRQRQAAAA